MQQGKQSVADLAFNQQDWTQRMPPGYRVQLRIDAVTIKPHQQLGGEVRHCTDLQWHMGGGFVPEVFGSALMLVAPDGKEVPNVFRRG